MSQASRKLALLALLLALVGCPKGLPQEATPDQLYSIGRERFDKRDWDEAIEALQRFLYLDPGHRMADSAQYLVGEAYFNKEQYLTAATEFLRLAQLRPAGPLADDSRYRACESYYNLSPRPELDQEYTDEAIGECRSVVLLYPGSPYANEASQRIRELTDKLARKYYLNALFYYKRRAYDSAIVYLEYVLEDYKGASVEPQALLTLYETYRELGYSREAEETRVRLLQEYPDSPQAREVEKNSPGAVG